MIQKRCRILIENTVVSIFMIGTRIDQVKELLLGSDFIKSNKLYAVPDNSAGADLENTHEKGDCPLLTGTVSSISRYHE